MKIKSATNINRAKFKEMAEAPHMWLDEKAIKSLSLQNAKTGDTVQLAAFAEVIDTPKGKALHVFEMSVSGVRATKRSTNPQPTAPTHPAA